MRVNKYKNKKDKVAKKLSPSSAMIIEGYNNNKDIVVKKLSSLGIKEADIKVAKLYDEIYDLR